MFIIITKILKHIMILNLKDIQQMNLNECIYKLCFKFTFVTKFYFSTYFQKSFSFYIEK